MEVRTVVPLAAFYKHADDKTVESRQFRHESKKTKGLRDHFQKLKR